MKTDEIKALLDKFYRGVTTRAEEKKLADVFRQNSLPDEFLPDKKLFLSFSEKTMEIPRDSSKRIETLIDSFTNENRPGKTAKHPQLFYLATAIAASLALIFGVRQLQKGRPTEPTLFTDTYKNPDDAYRATVDALQLFSENFSKGAESVEKANRHLEKAQGIISQSIK